MFGIDKSSLENGVPMHSSNHNVLTESIQVLILYFHKKKFYKFLFLKTQKIKFEIQNKNIQIN